MPRRRRSGPETRGATGPTYVTLPPQPIRRSSPSAHREHVARERLRAVVDDRGRIREVDAPAHVRIAGIRRRRPVARGDLKIAVRFSFVCSVRLQADVQRPAKAGRYTEIEIGLACVDGVWQRRVDARKSKREAGFRRAPWLDVL